MDLIDHPDRGYAHLPGISPYSGGVRALPGHRLRRIALREPVPWHEGFSVIDRTLEGSQRPARALCSVELRCPKPHSFGGFSSFNAEYRLALARRGVLLAGGENPVARTNVAPCLDAPAETELFAFGYSVPALDVTRPSFVVSGAGDLVDQSDLRPESIVGGDAPWSESAAERAGAVLDELERRCDRLGVTWDDSDAVVVYSAEPIHPVLEPVVLDRLGPAARRGVHWYLARPPVEGLLYEMDVRGGVEEVSL